MATLTLKRPSTFVKDGIALGNQSNYRVLKTIEQALYGASPDITDPDRTLPVDPRDLTGTCETSHLWNPGDVEPAGRSMESRPDVAMPVKTSDPMLGDLASRAGYLDASCVDDVAGYAHFHLSALFAVMDPFLIGDRNQAAEEMADALTAAFWRKANRYRAKMQRATAGLCDLERAWTGDDEIQITKRQQLEDQRDEASEAAARFELLFHVAEQVHLNVTGDTWQPPANGRSTSKFAEAGAAANAYVNGSVSGPNPSATTRVFITGDAATADHDEIVTVMDKLQKKHPTLTVYTGSNKAGVEAGIRGICKSRDIPCIVMAPNWERDGSKKAGFERNRAVFADAKPNGVVVIGGGGVQAHVLQMAEAAGVIAWKVRAPIAKAATA